MAPLGFQAPGAIGMNQIPNNAGSMAFLRSPFNQHHPGGHAPAMRGPAFHGPQTFRDA
jgi:hypothetical protein